MPNSVGEIIVKTLHDLGVEVVFGIPGVHSVELYRGLADSNIRHVTPRHEQGAGFMADGYARRAGKPGVCFVITGPGLTNIITPMAQAHADRIPILIISTINPTPQLGKNSGLLHALPNQSTLAKSVSLKSFTLTDPQNTTRLVTEAYFMTMGLRKGPVHIQIPTNILDQSTTKKNLNLKKKGLLRPKIFSEDFLNFKKIIEQNENILIFAGGGAVNAGEELKVFSEKLCAPVILTINARGLMSSSPLTVPASPSLPVIQGFIKNFDIAVVIGSELGPTDYDMFGTGNSLEFKKIIRVDTDPDPNFGVPDLALNIIQDSKLFLTKVNQYLMESEINRDNLLSARKKMISDTKGLLKLSFNEIEKKALTLLESIYLVFPHAIIIGDSTKPVYVGNDFINPPSPKTWFNAATGFGALGYAPPSAIGAQIASPKNQVICLVGDGGFQFSLTEIGAAVDEALPIIFIIWNNYGYKEIADYMDYKEIDKIGVNPAPPKFQFIAEAYSIPYQTLNDISDLQKVLHKARRQIRENNFTPCIIEIDEACFCLE